MNLPGGGENRGSCIRVAGDRVLVDIKARPGAPRSELEAVRDGRLRVGIAAAAEDGRANAELTALFARLLGCPKKNLRLTRGERSRLKTLEVPLIYREKIEILIAAIDKEHI
jgi:uncharacterized protein (TIGR00251 family)